MGTFKSDIVMRKSQYIKNIIPDFAMLLLNFFQSVNKATE